MLIDCGPRSGFTQARYVVRLSTGKNLVLFRLPSIDSTASKPNENGGWSYYAMESECPHAGGPMAESQVDIEDSAYIVTCPWHAYDFNVETGKSSIGPITACTFPVDVQGESVLLNFTDDKHGDVTLLSIEPVSEKVRLKKGGSRPAVSSSRPEESKSTEAPKYLGDEATLCDWCAHILNTAHPEHKIELTTYLFNTFAARESSASPMELGKGTVTAPAEPPRENLKAVRPGAAPNIGKGGSLRSRIAMLHALANIELWAIDLAIDICIRFSTFQTVKGSKDLPRAYFYDWLKVASDEAKHFSLLRSRLEDLGSYFGDLPVHHGLWQAAQETADDLLARISIVCLVHEARGLDVNPMTIQKFRKAGDALSVQAMEIIHNDEITHVTTGHRWLTWICGHEETDPVEVFRSNVQKHWRGAVRGPFNEEARMQAGMDPRYYSDLTGVKAS